MQDDISLLRELCTEIRDLDVGTVVPRIRAPVDALDFLANYVAKNKPVIITGAIDDWPALRRWRDAGYLGRAAGAAAVSINVTPNGRADAVTDVVVGGGGTRRVFAQPQQRRMTLRAFFKLLEKKPQGVVPYLSHQDGNLTAQLPALLADVAPALPWACAALGGPPEAVNLWIGDDRSETSFHKDHYENLYCVVRGTKTFHLLPPSDVWRLNLRWYDAAVYAPAPRGGGDVGSAAGEGEDEGELRPQLEEPARRVLWCDVEPLSTDAAHRAAHPHFFDASLPPPLVADVREGETLYLPACWYHYVEQSAAPDPLEGGGEGGGGFVAAVNMWHDMRFDRSHALQRVLVEGVARRAGLLPPDDGGESGGGG